MRSMAFEIQSSFWMIPIKPMRLSRQLFSIQLWSMESKRAGGRNRFGTFVESEKHKTVIKFNKRFVIAWYSSHQDKIVVNNKCFVSHSMFIEHSIWCRNRSNRIVDWRAKWRNISKFHNISRERKKCISLHIQNNFLFYKYLKRAQYLSRFLISHSQGIVTQNRTFFSVWKSIESLKILQLCKWCMALEHNQCTRKKRLKFKCFSTVGLCFAWCFLFCFVLFHFDRQFSWRGQTIIHKRMLFTVGHTIKYGQKTHTEKQNTFKLLMPLKERMQ